MQEEKRKLAFWELDRGRFAEAIQAAFEQAQKESFELGVSAKVSITISLAAPDPNDLQFGDLAWSVTQTRGSRSTSKAQSIERDELGRVIAAGENPAAILQIPLELPGLEVSEHPLSRHAT